MRSILLACLALLLPTIARAQGQGMQRFPCAHGDSVVFSSEGDLWTAPLAGGEASRLTVHAGMERHPCFSADGKWIAFTGEYDGGTDAYVMPAAGGQPRRLTWSPGADRVVGWTPDGRVLFRARGHLPFGSWTIWSVAPEGGDPVKVPLAEAIQASFGPGGKIAFVMWMWENQHWKRYSGGLAADIWVGDPAKGDFRKLTDWKGNDAYPMWHGDRIWYLTDRDGVHNLWSCREDGSDLRQDTKLKEWDARFPTLCDGKIAYQYGADIRVFDCATGKDRAIEIRLPTDRAEARAHLATAADRVERFSPSPDGTRLLVGSRGELFTLPLEKGRIVNLTRAPASRERSGTWSPDGKQVAHLSDATGEYEIWLADPTGATPARALTKVGKGWKLVPVWSPDSKKLAYSDMSGALIVVDAATGATTPVDKSATWEIGAYSWSPDSRWLAYEFPVENWNIVIRIRDTAQNKTLTVTDARWSSWNPAWDPEGKFLAFLSSRSINPKSGDYGFEYDFSLDDTVKPYLLRLKADARAGFEPQEKGLVTKPKDDDESKKKGDKPKEVKVVDVVIEEEGILDRCIQVPVHAGNMRKLTFAKDRLLWLEWKNTGWAPDADDDGAASLIGFAFATSKRVAIAKKVDDIEITADASVLVVRQGTSFIKAEASATTLPKEAPSKYFGDAWTVPVDPGLEWRQIFAEVWRLERDFFYDPALHRVDWEAARTKYEALLPRVSSREELNDLIGEMIAELSNSHAYISGGKERRGAPTTTGTLGARITADATTGRYRFEKIFRGDTWNPKEGSPLVAAGVKEGDWLLAIDGAPVKAGDRWERAMADKAGRPVLLTVSSKPDGSSPREAYVVALAGDDLLVYRDWVEKNRAWLDEKSGGKVGYIYVPDMGGFGLIEFARQFSWQSQKDALVIDVRFNNGGNTHGMILERLRRFTTHWNKARHFGAEPVPWRSTRGNLVALMNHDTASDGENFIHAWQQAELGPVIGTRSWGGLVGYRGDKDLIDGGFNSQPEYAHFSWKGAWIVEGDGAIPGIEVMNTPGTLAAGRDEQLERGLAEALAQIEKNPRKPPAIPEAPDKSK